MKSRAYFVATVAFLCVIAASNVSFAQVACTPTSNYSTTAGPGAIVPGTTDIGQSCDDCFTTVTIPFPVRMYDQAPDTTINIVSNGNAQLVSTNTAFTNFCPMPVATMNNAYLPFWDDLRTDDQPGCTGYPGGLLSSCGIFTSISGVAPNRIFNIEWRTVYFDDPTLRAHLQLRLNEANAQFVYVYGPLQGLTTSATVGVQEGNGVAPNLFVQTACDGPGVTQNQQVAYNCTLVPVELQGFSIE